MKVDFFLAFFIFEAKLVEVLSAAGLTAAALDARLRLVIRQSVRRHFTCVVNAADNNRLVWIAFEEINDDFLVDSGNVNHAPLFSRQQSSNPHPTGAILVKFALAVPVKLHFHTAVFVSKNFFAFGTDDDGSLGTLHHRFRS